MTTHEISVVDDDVLSVERYVHDALANGRYLLVDFDTLTIREDQVRLPDVNYVTQADLPKIRTLEQERVALIKKKHEAITARMHYHDDKKKAVEGLALYGSDVETWPDEYRDARQRAIDYDTAHMKKQKAKKGKAQNVQ